MEDGIGTAVQILIFKSMGIGRNTNKVVFTVKGIGNETNMDLSGSEVPTNKK
jgi:hypothetical protein